MVFYGPLNLAGTISSARAVEPIEMSQRMESSTLSQVLPEDWAFTALRRLMKEYSCLDGYAAWLFSRNRAMTRYEFASGINACLDVVIQTIDQARDLDTIRRLQQEFASELLVLRS